MRPFLVIQILSCRDVLLMMADLSILYARSDNSLKLLLNVMCLDTLQQVNQMIPFDLIAV